MLSQQRWIVVHEFGAPSHYAGLRLALQLAGEDVVFVELNLYRQALRILAGRRASQWSKTLANIGFLLRCAATGARGQSVILGMAPYNVWLPAVSWLLRNANIYMHLSWPVWDGSRQPHRPFSRYVRLSWHRFMRHQVRHVLIATEIAKRSLASSAYGGAPATVVAHGFDPEVFFPDAEHVAEPARMVFVGRLDQTKGIHQILQIALQLPQYELVLIGDGPLRERVQAAARQLPNVRYCGHISDRAKLAAELRRCQILLLPSIRAKRWEEAFGMAMIEGMACGLVPMTTDHVGPVEVLGRQLPSLTFSEQDFVKGVCTQMQAWAETPDAYRGCREVAICIAAQYRIERIARRWAKALEIPAVDARRGPGQQLDADGAMQGDATTRSNDVAGSAEAAEAIKLDERVLAAEATAERHAVLWSVLNALGTKGTSLVVYLLLARVLGPEVFGIAALGLAATSLMEVVCEHRFGPILIQRERLSDAELSTVFLFQTSVGLVATALLVVGAGLISDLVAEPRVEAVLPWLSIAMLLNTTTYVHESLLRRNLQFKTLTIRNMAANLLGGLVGVVLAIAGFGIESLIAMVLTSAIAGAAVLWATSRWRPTELFSFQAFMPLYRDARHIASTSILSAVAMQANMFIVGHAFGATVAGLYSFALRIYDVVMRVTTFSFSEAAFPILAKKIREPERYRNTFVGLLSSAGTLTVGLLMIAGGLSPLAVPLIFGEQWAPAADYLMIYLLGGAIISMGAYNDVTLMAFARTRKLAETFYASLIIWLVQLPLLTVLGPLFPAIIWCTKELFIFPWKAKWALKLMEMPARQYVRLLVPVLAAGLLALATVILVQMLIGTPGIWHLVLCTICGLLVFGISVAVIDGETPSSLLSRFTSLRKLR